MNLPGWWQKEIGLIDNSENSGLLIGFLVGKNVKDVSIGDRVAMEPGTTCKVCEACKSGKYEVSVH